MWQFIVTVFICSVHRAAGYASYMTSSACTRSIAAGITIMGKSAISETSRQITVRRGSTFLSSGDNYTPGEQLEVSLSDTSGQYVFELNQGSFQGGSCSENRRYANGIGTLNTPAAGSGSLVILGAWAPSKTNVRIVTPFTLIEAGALPTSHPTLLPRIELTLEPSFQPTPQPGDTPLPTQRPTTATLMLVTYTAEQALTNITAKELNEDQGAELALAATMQLTLTETMAPLATPLFVNVSTVKTLSELSPVAASLDHSEQRDSKQSFLRHSLYEVFPLETTEPSTRVSYLIAFYLEETAYETPEDLLEGLDIALNVVMDSQLFLATLRSFNVSALNNAHTASMLSTALEGVEVLRSAAPTVAPSRSPTHSPSPAPTVNTASLDTSSITDDAYHAPQRSKVIVGVVVGGVAAAVLALSLHYYATATSETVVQVQWVLSGLPVMFALACAAAAIGLVAAWASPAPADDPFYLNKPDWRSNVFAYHPVFMTLFCALQVQALCTWSLFSVHLTAKIAHVAVQVCAVAAVVMGLISIVQHMWDTRSPSLVSMHSWVGVAAVAVFGFNFLWGSAMGYLSAFHKHSPLHVRLSLLLCHKFLGVTALVLAAVALNTGVMDKLLSGACDYHVDINADPQQDFDPAENYSYIPGSCKLGNGLGMAVLAATVCAVLSVLVRNVRGEGYTAVLVQKTGTNLEATPEDSPIRSLGENLYVNFGRERWQPYHPRPQTPAIEEGKGEERTVQQGSAEAAMYCDGLSQVQQSAGEEASVCEGEQEGADEDEGQGGETEQVQEGKEDQQEGAQSSASSNALLDETVL